MIHKLSGKVLGKTVVKRPLIVLITWVMRMEAKKSVACGEVTTIVYTTHLMTTVDRSRNFIKIFSLAQIMKTA